MAKLGILTIHGMGRTREDYADDFKEEIGDRLGRKSKDVVCQSVYYQDLLQNNQDRYYEAVEGLLDWGKLRRFVLFGFSDAASLESQKGGNGSPYFRAQERILKELKALYGALDSDAPVVIVAQSLGGQVLSNYLWDSQQKNPHFGIWAQAPKFSDKKEEAFCRGKSIRFIFTTGCNIPIFVAGIHQKLIKPIDPPSVAGEFDWHNFYDADDVLGWPLQDLSQAYGDLVQDHRINTGFTPKSHVNYWSDRSFLKPFIRHIKPLL